RRRAGDQPRMDTEAASGPGLPRLHHRSRHRHHPSPHARLCTLYMPQILAHPFNFQPLPVVDYSKSFNCAHYSTAEQSIVGIPFWQPKRHRLSLSAFDAARFLHVASQHHRLPGREDGSRHAAHLHTHDLAPDGTPQKVAPELKEAAWSELCLGSEMAGIGQIEGQAVSFERLDCAGTA